MGYATTTRTKRNISVLREHGWRLLLTPDIRTDHGMPYAIDNGAWGCHQRGESFNSLAFCELVTSHGRGADWIVVPDIVEGGIESLRFTAEWLPRLEGIAPLLVAIQDGYTREDVEPWLGPTVGLFLGGSTAYKEQMMPFWGRIAKETGCYYHVARVNSKRRVKLCAMAGADSIDGTSCTRFAVNTPKMTAALHQGTLWTQGEV